MTFDEQWFIVSPSLHPCPQNELRGSLIYIHDRIENAAVVYVVTPHNLRVCAQQNVLVERF